jgi:hypothetical protein
MQWSCHLFFMPAKLGTVYSRHSRKLNHFHLGCLRKLLTIKRQDHIPDTEVLERANMNSVHTMLRKA